MMKVKSVGKYKTSLGLAFIVKCSEIIKVGQNIIIDDNVYSVKKIQMPTFPSDEGVVALFV